jgi:magnesium chelatase subunit D
MRGSLHLLRAARAAAALRGALAVEVADAAVAMRLVLGLVPSPPPEQAVEDAPAPEPQETAPDPSSPEEALSADALQEMLVQAIEASVPRDLLDSLKQEAARRTGQTATGKAGAARNRGTRGRPVGTADKPPVPGARIDVLATLRQAAPWQRIRVRDGAPRDGRLHIRKDDFRYVRYRENTATTAIFVVDASGSAAVDRLAETKGAIELLLAQCYVRRDSVALIAFRGEGAETLLEPTRSLVRAKRSLSALPGGGGTPLASGILAALRMATNSARAGQGVVTVFLTDGRGNVGLDGTTDRDRVGEDTGRTARLFRAGGLRSILIDTAQRPQPRAEALARELGAEYLPLPRGGARALSREIGARMEDLGHGAG